MAIRERIAQVFSTAALAAAAAFLAYSVATRSATTVGDTATPAQLSEGDRLGEWWGRLSPATPIPGPTVVAVFAPDCLWSRYSVASWNRIAKELRERDLGSTVGVSLGDSAASAVFQDETRLELPVRLESRPGAVDAWRIPAVPYTVYIDASGTVRAAWRGYVDDAVVQEVLAVAAGRGEAHSQPAGAVALE